MTNSYEVRKVIVTHLSQIAENIYWADLCWFEWCEDLVVFASNTPFIQRKKFICRFHSYEAFTELSMVNKKIEALIEGLMKE